MGTALVVAVPPVDGGETILNYSGEAELAQSQERRIRRGVACMCRESVEVSEIFAAV